MHCDTGHKRHLVAFSCKGRGFCPTCMGRRMNEGAANPVDHVLPEHVPIRQWVLTLPYPLRYPLAFDARHLGHVLHLFTDTVGAWYRRHHPGGKTGSVTVIQRASSDLRLNPHFHTLFLDCVYVPAQCPSEGSHAAPSAPLFQAAPKPTQEDIEFVVTQARKRILRSLENRGAVTFAAAPGDGEVNAVLGEGFGVSEPAHSTLVYAATSGLPPAGPAQKRTPVRMSREVDARLEPKGYLCAQVGAFNLHAARRVAPNDKQGKEILCRYILRPPLANLGGPSLKRWISNGAARVKVGTGRSIRTDWADTLRGKDEECLDVNGGAGDGGGKRDKGLKNGRMGLELRD